MTLKHLRKIIVYSLVAALTLLHGVLFLARAFPANAYDYPIHNAEGKKETSFLQFVSNKSIFQFDKEGIVIASNNGMLKIGFVNPNWVEPTSTLPQLLDKVTYSNLWDGVTVIYQNEPDTLLKSTYLVTTKESESFVHNIQLRYSSPVNLDSNGNLIIHHDGGDIIEKSPIAWQELNGKRFYVPVSFSIQNDGTVGFSIGSFIPNLPIIIDPAIVWNTFQGGNGNDTTGGIFVDSNNNVYVGGNSSGSWGSPIRPYTSGTDTYLMKMDSNGKLLWLTFLGGSGTDNASQVDVDSSGNVYLVGYSAANWGSPLNAYTSGNDAFLAKVDQDGNLLWSTFIGAAGGDLGTALKVGSDNEIYVSGTSAATWGSPARAYTAGNDGFLAKYDASGTRVWNTFLGGAGSDSGGSGLLATDDSYLYLSGTSAATWGSPARAYSAATDSYVAKVDKSNGSLIWNSFIGGSSNDMYTHTVIDSNGNLYIGGISLGTWGSPLRAYTVSPCDLGVAKMDNNGNLLWNTFLGGSGSEITGSIEVDDQGNSYPSARGTATWGTPLSAYTALSDITLSKLDTNGNLIWSTFIGGSGDELTPIMSAIKGNHLYLSGQTNASWGTPVDAYVAGIDTMIVKYDIAAVASSISSSGINSSGATIQWNTDFASSSQIEYGTSDIYGQFTAEGDTTTRVTSHSVALTGLTPCTTYYYRPLMKDAQLTQGYGTGGSFVTSCNTAVASSTSTSSVAYQIPVSNGSNQWGGVLNPIRDSITGDQRILAIIEPQTLAFNAFLFSRLISPTALSPINLIKYGPASWQVGNIYEIWYKAYPPTGSSNEAPIIIPSLQDKPSILSLSYNSADLIPAGDSKHPFQPKNLKIAHSIDGKNWKILISSVVDDQNKTVSVIQRVGGYYMLVHAPQINQLNKSLWPSKEVATIKDTQPHTVEPTMTPAPQSQQTAKPKKCFLWWCW